MRATEPMPSQGSLFLKDLTLSLSCGPLGQTNGQYSCRRWNTLATAASCLERFIPDDELVLSLIVTFDQRHRMSNVLQRPPPSSGGTPTKPTSCETSTVITIFSRPLITRSQGRTFFRCRRGVFGHCKGIGRRLSTPQVVFRRNQRTDQAL